MLPLVLLAVLAAGAQLANVQAAPGDPALAYIIKNNPVFKQVFLDTLGIKSVPSKANLTVLVPSDKAIAEFARKMGGLTTKELAQRRVLVDLIAAYHVLPAVTDKQIDSLSAATPTVARTADENYIQRWYKKGDQVWVQDAQNNNVSVAGKPQTFGGVTLVPVDAVLMSGGYFYAIADALRHYPQWSDAYKLAQAVGYPVANSSLDLTFFVPDNEAIAGRKPFWEQEPAAVRRAQLLYHLSAPARAVVPGGLSGVAAGGRLPTLLAGHSIGVKVAAAGNSSGAPNITLVPEVGPPVELYIVNVFAGRGVLQGVDGNLLANVTAATAPPLVTKPAVAGAAAAAKQPAAAAAGRRRSLLRYGYGGGGNRDTGYQQATVNSIAASNTQYAIEQAASGNIPTWAATSAGSYNAKAAASYNNYGYGGCWNCRY